MGCTNDDIILQGTTPSLEIPIDANKYFTVDTMIAVELTFIIDGNLTIKSLSDVSISVESNSFFYTFTEEETLAFNPKSTLFYQWRAKTSNGKIYGSLGDTIEIAELMSHRLIGA